MMEFKVNLRIASKKIMNVAIFLIESYNIQRIIKS